MSQGSDDDALAPTLPATLTTPVQNSSISIQELPWYDLDLDKASKDPLLTTEQASLRRTTCTQAYKGPSRALFSEFLSSAMLCLYS